ncbi:hypothetical protein HUU53_04090 [Candidatus Micrarchaeota archaeon]|nr:hypothetical protein [Candidatus Micrarchaeota archaeon]
MDFKKAFSFARDFENAKYFFALNIITITILLLSLLPLLSSFYNASFSIEYFQNLLLTSIQTIILLTIIVIAYALANSFLKTVFVFHFSRKQSFSKSISQAKQAYANYLLAITIVLVIGLLIDASTSFFPEYLAGIIQFILGGALFFAEYFVLLKNYPVIKSIQSSVLLLKTKPWLTLKAFAVTSLIAVFAALIALAPLLSILIVKTNTLLGIAAIAASVIITALALSIQSLLVIGIAVQYFSELK